MWYTLHSNLVLFKYRTEDEADKISKLYIPIWFYSNKPTDEMAEAMGKLFTFQSGSIQMVKVNVVIIGCPFFTFQSGSIQIFLLRVIGWSMKTFTFQSGSIQIQPPYQDSYTLSIFTFQSGSIQIGMAVSSLTKNITLHSNLVLFKCIHHHL